MNFCILKNRLAQQQPSFLETVSSVVVIIVIKIKIIIITFVKGDPIKAEEEGASKQQAAGEDISRRRKKTLKIK